MFCSSTKNTPPPTPPLPNPHTPAPSWGSDDLFKGGLHCFDADGLALIRFDAKRFRRRHFVADMFWRRDDLGPDILATSYISSHIECLKLFRFTSRYALWILKLSIRGVHSFITLISAFSIRSLNLKCMAKWVYLSALSQVHSKGDNEHFSIFHTTDKKLL